jgi:hypothetical protein
VQVILPAQEEDRVLPIAFDWHWYLQAHPDLARDGCATAQCARVHYRNRGRLEERPYRPT